MLTVITLPITSFDIILIVAILIVVGLLAVIYFQMWRVESIEKNTLSIYAYLSTEDIQALHTTTQSYLLQITDGSYQSQILPLENSEGDP